jgi:pyruvate/2-oxoglutarate/acetoin dehydrogenase E1 component/TPP-dependent pyruvate/acetoin dehydrogenase alpha subunit
MPDAKTQRGHVRKTEFDKEETLQDYRICCLSREASILARKEVLTGRANFGIIGDGKELAQVAMSKAWRPGDFRSGYYRDQTLMLALGVTDLDAFFAQLYGDPYGDPFSGGRQMNCHFATPLIDGEGNWTSHIDAFNISSDIAPTGGQMARGLGLALASKKFRELPHLCGNFSRLGGEVVFVTIGDASTSEGVFWETMNAACVMQVPLAVSVWDDGYGISVPRSLQTTKDNISKALEGFRADADGGMDIYQVRAWDYADLCRVYREGIARMRETHRPALFHIIEVTQQLGHSTSGDHRRYKSADRLVFEEDYDCNRRFAEWIIASGIAGLEELEAIQQASRKLVTEAAGRAFRAYHERVQADGEKVVSLVQAAAQSQPTNQALGAYCAGLVFRKDGLRYEVVQIARRAALLLAPSTDEAALNLKHFCAGLLGEGERVYSSHLYATTGRTVAGVATVSPVYTADSPMKDGFEILNACFDHHFAHLPELFAFGEDVGQIGDVNQGLRGMQQKYGESRVFDTGIREWTIMGQAIGMAMRGLRPIAEIQYLDYLLYGLSPLSDDLATLRWRSNNQQMAPAIIRTRGHRLVGVWHAGSPMSLMLGSLRGMWICVPRNMTQAAGMYNTLLQSDDPAIVVEVLNAYRMKERLPDNVGTFTIPLGKAECLRVGEDLTVVTYGASVKIALEAGVLLDGMGISIEVIDIQTLLPFDLDGLCVQSLRKTSRILFLDEDFEGGGTGYLLQQVLEVQGGYRYLDIAPATLHGRPHRPAYGQDGDYFSKPQVEDVVEKVREMVLEL